jgi:hypothetical protein
VPVGRLFQGFFEYLPDLLKAFGSHDQVCSPFAEGSRGPGQLRDLFEKLTHTSCAINVFCELAEL